MLENNIELRVVDFRDDMRDAGLNEGQAEAYSQFDKCKICTRFGAGSASDARQVAEAIIESGIDTDNCTKGIRGVTCPYGDSRVAVIDALKHLIKISES